METAKVGSIDAGRVAASHKFMQVPVKGRIEAQSTFEGVRYTRVITPAVDSYSKPQVLEIRSKTRLGDVGDESIFICTLGGYMRKPYTVTDQKTGEVRKVQPVEMTLDLVESN